MDARDKYDVVIDVSRWITEEDNEEDNTGGLAALL